MSDKIKIVLELTQFEAEVLMRLTMRAVGWVRSGEFGKAAQDVYSALSSAEVNEAIYDPSSQDRMLWKRRVGA